jgi:hypothetical protein
MAFIPGQSDAAYLMFNNPKTKGWKWRIPKFVDEAELFLQHDDACPWTPWLSGDKTPAPILRAVSKRNLSLEPLTE